MRALIGIGFGISLGISAVAFGCGGTTPGNGFDTTDAGSGSADSGAITSNEGGGLTETDSGGPTGTTLFYVHTDTTLYSLDPNDISATPTKIGDFDCITGSGDSKAMTDIGVAKDGSLYGVSQGAAYPLTITGSSVHCAATWPLPGTSNNFYGLTVAPENTVEADEVLIAADNTGALYQIDANTGHTTQVGTFGFDASSGKKWVLSGDIVFLANSGSPLGFATVRTCDTNGNNCTSTDTLIQIDVSKVKPGTQPTIKSVQGTVNKGAWCTNSSSPASFGSMYGIAAFQDKVYGFSREGDVVEIHNDDGSGCLINSYSSMKFAGAGVTTSAPVIAPR